MTNIVLLVAALLFAFGVLIGSVLHTQAVHREYRRIAERVRELHEIQEALADQNKVPVLAGSSDRSPGDLPRVTTWQTSPGEVCQVYGYSGSAEPAGS